MKTKLLLLVLMCTYCLKSNAQFEIIENTPDDLSIYADLYVSNNILYYTSGLFGDEIVSIKKVDLANLSQVTEIVPNLDLGLLGFSFVHNDFLYYSYDSKLSKLNLTTNEVEVLNITGFGLSYEVISDIMYMKFSDTNAIMKKDLNEDFSIAPQLFFTLPDDFDGAVGARSMTSSGNKLFISSSDFNLGKNIAFLDVTDINPSLSYLTEQNGEYGGEILIYNDDLYCTCANPGGPRFLKFDITATNPTPETVVNAPDFAFNYDEENGILYTNSNTVVYKTDLNATLGIEDTQETLNDLKVSIYPNPASNQIQISRKQQNNFIAQVEIFDNLGRTIKKQNIDNNNTSIDISTISSGVLFVKIQIGEQQVIKTLVKK